MKNRIALLGATAVALGALGAHSLKGCIRPEFARILQGCRFIPTHSYFGTPCLSIHRL